MGSAPSVQLSHRFERRIVKRLTIFIRLKARYDQNATAKSRPDTEKHFLTADDRLGSDSGKALDKSFIPRRSDEQKNRL
jgi:hypothetical protein